MNQSIQKTPSWPGAVTQACNPSYLGGRDQKNCGLRATSAKVHKTPSQAMTGQGSSCVSSQLSGEVQMGETWSGLA
jgi:hypothetical protein